MPSTDSQCLFYIQMVDESYLTIQQEQVTSCNKRQSQCVTVLPGADVERPVDLEDPLDVQRLLPQPRPVGSTQEDSVPPHHCQHTTKSIGINAAWGHVSSFWRFISRTGHWSPQGEVETNWSGFQENKLVWLLAKPLFLY